MECRRGRGRPRKRPTDNCLQPLPSFLLQPITQKTRIHTTTTHMEESITFGVQTGSEAGRRTRPEGIVVYRWGCDRPQKGPNDENFQPLPSFNLQPVITTPRTSTVIYLVEGSVTNNLLLVFQRC